MLNVAAETYNEKIKETFPSFYTVARVQKIIGAEHIIFEFSNVSSPAEAPNGILLNATAHMRFMLSKEVEHSVIELLTWHYKLKPTGVKFRKIKGKTPVEAVEKLLKWFSKNKPLIESV